MKIQLLRLTICADRPHYYNDHRGTQKSLKHGMRFYMESYRNLVKSIQLFSQHPWRCSFFPSCKCNNSTGPDLVQAFGAGLCNTGSAEVAVYA